MTGVRWAGRAGQGDISPTAAQIAALDDFRDLQGRGVTLTKEMALGIGRAHELTRTELIQVMDEWMGSNATRAAS